MGSRIEYSEEMLLTAIKDSAAIMTTIAKRLDCEWHTAKKYIELYDSCKQALLDENEKTLDMAESVVYKSIQTGNTQDAKWLLGTKGKQRGYSEKVKIGLVIEEDNDFKIVKKENADS